MRSKTSVTIAAILLPAMVLAQPKQKVQIKQATIFLRGAELTSTAKFSIPKGESEVLLTNVAGNILPQSLSVGASGNVIIQSATPQNNYLSNSSVTPRAQGIKDSIEQLNNSTAILGDKLVVVEEQMQLLRANRKVTTDEKSLPVAELQKMLDLFKTKMDALLSEKYSINKESKKISERIALLQLQLNEEMNREHIPGGQVLVKFYAPEATSTNINLTYVVSNAGWTPYYDLRADKISAPVKLAYKANVFQNSGLSWDNVHVVLSTGNPSEGAEAPVFNPWYLSFVQPMYRSYKPAAAANMNAFRGNNFQAYDLKEKYLADADSLGAIRYDGLDEYVKVDNDGINTSFEIDLSYTIPSDGQQHSVAIKNYELPATYSYYAMPKVDKDAFLQARITNWQDLNLMPGKTNIFYEGTYVGQGMIAMRNVKDTMNISLGRDKKIIIRREKDKAFHARSTVGTTQKEVYAYTISVRNTRQDAIDLILMDQFPVSNDKDIVIEDTEAVNAVTDGNLGSVKWTLTLKPNELHSEKLKFTVKYPKTKALALN